MAGQGVMFLLNSFRPLTLDEMNEEDLKNLATVVRQDPEMTQEFVRDKLLKGEMIPWRVEGSRGNAILMLEIKQKRTEKVLYVWYLSGKGIVGNGHYILDTLEAIAKLNNCVAVEAFTSLRFGKYLSRPEGGFKIKHVFVRKEL